MGNSNFSNGMDLSKQPQEVLDWLEFMRKDQEEMRRVLREDHEYFSRPASSKN